MAVVVPIVTEWNPRGLEKALADIEKAEGAFGKTKATLEAAFLPAAATLGAVGTAAVIAGEKAAGLEQAMSKVEHVFGSAGTDLIEWAKDAPDKLGLTEKAALSTAFIFGQFADAAGLAGDDLSGFSKDLSTLAADLAAIEGVDTQTAVTALASGLRGSYEPLRQFGILLSQAEVNAKAVDLGLAETADSADQTAKTIAAAALVQEKGAFANGFFAESSGNLLIEQQKLKATIEQITAEMGEAFLPILESVVGLFSSFAGWARENEGLLQLIILAVGGLSAAIVIANGALKIYEGLGLAIKTATLLWEGAQWLLNAALGANPIGLIVIALAAFVGGIILAYNKVGWFRDFVDAAWGVIKSATEKVFPIIQSIIEDVWERIQAVTEVVFPIIQSVIETVWGVLKRLFEFTPVGFVITHFEELQEVTSKVWNAIQGVIETVVGKITSIIDGVIGKIGEAIKKVKDFAGNIPFIGGLFHGTEGGSSSYLLTGTSSGLLGASGGPSVVVNVNAGVGDPLAIARAIEATLRTRGMRLGVA